MMIAFRSGSFIFVSVIGSEINNEVPNARTYGPL